ncbi:MAG: hypothetical protein K2W95_00900 [Candidatus Obscuribacterales bacterium]|nr:hypothetical protein [Candidatus Obscuribacterales bacterium]
MRKIDDMTTGELVSALDLTGSNIEDFLMGKVTAELFAARMVALFAMNGLLTMTVGEEETPTAPEQGSKGN